MNLKVYSNNNNIITLTGLEKSKDYNDPINNGKSTEIYTVESQEGKAAKPENKKTKKSANPRLTASLLSKTLTKTRSLHCFIAMARAALLRLLRHRLASATATSTTVAPLSVYRCLMSSNSKTPAAIKWESFCRPFSSNAAVNDVIGIDIPNTDSGVADMEGKERLDPFSLVADELSLISSRLRSMVVTEVPNLASASEYFFKIGAEGKRFRPTVLLLMATALSVHIPEVPHAGVEDTLPTDLRTSQQRIAEITEMIHVASLLHDDVLDDADKRRGVGSLNAVMGNKLAVLAGDFLLSRACVALASLKNTEVVTLIATVVENLVTGETMQLTTASKQRFSMEYYMQKTYKKTASLISNSCKSIAILAGHTTEVAMLAFEYGKNLGLAFQLIDDVLDFTGTLASLGKGSLFDIRHGIITAPILFAMEEYPQLHAVVDQGFDNPANIDIALEYLGKSSGIQRTKELAMKHANLAAAVIDSLPESDDEDVIRSRQALVDLTQRVITRNK